MSRTMSLVDVSPSTVRQWNVRSTTRRKMDSRAGRGTAASVVITESIVAICGWIIPAPFTMPPIRTVRPPILPSTAQIFSRVSVVIMARAAVSHPSGLKAATAAGIPFSSFWRGSATPMTPVLATTTWDGSISRWEARQRALLKASAMPRLAVHALAHPELRSTARIRPRARLRCFLLSSTGAAFTKFVVKTAQATEGLDEKTTARSRPCFLISAATPEARNPRAAVTPPDIRCHWGRFWERRRGPLEFDLILTSSTTEKPGTALLTYSPQRGERKLAGGERSEPP